MWAPYILFVSAIISSTAVNATTLIEALQGAGASEFATRIEADPNLGSVFFSGQVQTVFAPIDGCAYPSQRKGKRQTNNQNLLYHGIQQSNSLGAMSAGSGKPMESNDKSANLGGVGQSIVSNPLNVTQSNVAKRWPSVPLRRHSHSNSTSPPSLLKIFTGLGNNVSIIQGDIQYDGGVLHIIDSYFTLPEPLSSTAIANGHTTFASLTNTSGTSSALDNTPSVTVFVPFNAAFSVANTTTNYTSSASLLSGHVIPNFVGYLPALINGATYQTQGGTNVTVTVRGNDYYINNAKIIASNQIIENGVAHVIDQIIVPATPAPITFVGSASRNGMRQLVELFGLLVLVAGFLI